MQPRCDELTGFTPQPFTSTWSRRVLKPILRSICPQFIESGDIWRRHYPTGRSKQGPHKKSARQIGSPFRVLLLRICLLGTSGRAREFIVNWLGLLPQSRHAYAITASSRSSDMVAKRV